MSMQIFCPEVGEPTKSLEGAKMWINKMDDGRQTSRIVLEAGFDWTKVIKPILPGCPDWCPATHFGYLESGKMGVRMKDDPDNIKWIKAGESYMVPPGHLPVIEEKTVMIEFTQDTTFTNKEFIEKKAE